MIKRVLFVIVYFVFITIGLSAKSKTANIPKFKTNLDSVSYSIGQMLGLSIKKAGISQINEKFFIKALLEVLKTDSAYFKNEKANEIIQSYLSIENQKKAKESIEKSKNFLEDNAKKEGVKTLPSGLQYKIISEGQGESPTINDKVTAHYKGTLVDGTTFDSSYERNEPVQFPVNGVIKGWTEALQLMKTGAKWQLFIPSELGYGAQDIPSIPANSILIFDVELISIDK